MSSATFVGTNSAGSSDFCPAPPPPPPPPPISGQVPAMRINTVKPTMSRRPQSYNNDPYEPPAAIQNAMMTKDKKPFTYTPGMGGKLDLSQIRSPRMARRVAKNANDEGIEGPPKSPLATEQPRPVSTSGTNLFVQPQVAVPVFPTNPPSPPSLVQQQVNRPSQMNRSVANDRNVEISKPTIKIDQKPPSQLIMSSPETPSTPTQVTLTKAPTPWMQNKSKQQVELPEWARRSPTSNGSSSSYTPGDSLNNNTQTIYIQQPLQQKVQSKSATNERIIPLHLEDRPSVFAGKNELGHQQFKQQSSPHHQQRWGQPNQQSQCPSVTRVVSTPMSPLSTPCKSAQASVPETYIVPIVVENSNNTTYIQRNDFSSGNIQNQGHTPRTVINQQEPGPVQSRSFRVLQKIHDTDNDDIDTEQLRKLQLTEDDKVLMNKFKEQVDGDTYLHQEEDPRYRGAAIPSRAFRYLQNMTDSNEVSMTNVNVPGAVNSALKRQNRNSRTFEETQSNLPPSQQQVPEPKKYTGSAIPSRSFRILQAMTSPEDAAKEDNGQADFTCQVSSSMIPMGNQQGVFIPHYSPSNNIYWAYYPISNIQYPSSFNQSINYYEQQNNNDNNTTLNVPNIANTFAYCSYQDVSASSPVINNYSISPTSYYPPIYHYITEPNMQNLTAEQQKIISDNTLRTSDEFAAAISMSSQPAYRNHNNDDNNSSPRQNIDNKNNNNDNSNSCETSNNNNNNNNSKDKMYAMNIIYEENDYDNNNKKHIDEINRSIKNNNNINEDSNNCVTDSDESSSDDDSSGDSSSIRNHSSNEKIEEVEAKESSSSDDDSESYLAYSTGLNNTGKESKDKLKVSDGTDDKQNTTDCESYVEEEEIYSIVAEESEKKTNDEINTCDDCEDNDNNNKNFDATVIVNLPLRVKCYASTDNSDKEPVAVIVDDSKSNTKELNINQNVPDNQDNGNNDDDNNNVYIHLKINNENITDSNTSANFTLKKRSLKRPESWCPEVSDDFWTSETIISRQLQSPTNLDLRNKIVNEDVCKDDEKNNITDEIKIPKFFFTVDEELKTEPECVDLSKNDCDNKYLLTAVNSRDETDDEDSGVTSDMSRLISEVDTDSECTPSRKINTYSRTQTHSRLFKLLTDDLTISEITEMTDSKPMKINRLSLPLKKSSRFTYSNSNNSSGSNLSDASLVQKSTWKRLDSSVNNCINAVDNSDKYFKNWKDAKQKQNSPQTVVKISSNDKEIKYLPYKTNILCPRIKSGTNIPKILENRLNKSVITSCTNKYDCC